MVAPSLNKCGRVLRNRGSSFVCFVLASECHGGQAGHNRGKVVRRSDTNILAVKFNRLVEPSDVHTGDPVVCGNDGCSAILSHLSSITDQQDKQEKVRKEVFIVYLPCCDCVCFPGVGVSTVGVSVL